MKYAGILRIGYKLLVNDRAKFSALLVGITFSVFLMMQMTAMFAGILNRAYSTVTNIGAPMWIIDPAVNTPTSVIPMMTIISFLVGLSISGQTFYTFSVIGWLGQAEGIERRDPFFVGGLDHHLDSAGRGRDH
jgi:uncharacterized ion transporter superfamily protein YfcC